MPRPRKNTKKKRTVSPWTPADLKALRRLARRSHARDIARQLKRTESAVRQKASSLGVSLELR